MNNDTVSLIFILANGMRCLQLVIAGVMQQA
jgi:hypothetical protein